MVHGRKACSTASKVDRTEAARSATSFLTGPAVCMARRAKAGRDAAAASSLSLPEAEKVDGRRVSFIASEALPTGLSSTTEWWAIQRATSTGPRCTEDSRARAASTGLNPQVHRVRKKTQTCMRQEADDWLQPLGAARGMTKQKQVPRLGCAQSGASSLRMTTVSGGL